MKLPAAARSEAGPSSSTIVRPDEPSAASGPIASDHAPPGAGTHDERACACLTTAALRLRRRRLLLLLRRLRRLRLRRVHTAPQEHWALRRPTTWSGRFW